MRTPELRLGAIARERDLAGLRIVVTGGGTAEPIDLVRVVTRIEAADTDVVAHDERRASIDEHDHDHERRDEDEHAGRKQPSTHVTRREDARPEWSRRTARSLRRAVPPRPE